MNEYVIPETIWPCLAYVLKRAGHSGLLTFEWVNETLPSLLTRYESHSAGDILVWKNHGERLSLYAPVQIDTNQRVISRLCKYDYHFTYCDTDELMSDLVMGENTLPFVVKLRLISESSHPDFILRLR